uniref:Uncharacterized protein n=1 Tax=Anopheles quadriannulatus TaxID=34691 RepID=A0A182XDM3_ANOQN
MKYVAVLLISIAIVCLFSPSVEGHNRHGRQSHHMKQQHHMAKMMQYLEGNHLSRMHGWEHPRRRHHDCDDMNWLPWCLENAPERRGHRWMG